MRWGGPWCRPVPCGRRGTVPGAERADLEKNAFYRKSRFLPFLVPPRVWLLGLNWLQIGARPGLDIPKGKLSARGRPWGPQVPRWGPLKTAIIPKITPKVGCNSTSKGARNANPGLFQVPWTPLSDLDQKTVMFRNYPSPGPGSREGAVTEEAQGRQGRNEAQVPESESSPRAEA